MQRVEDLARSGFHVNLEVAASSGLDTDAFLTDKDAVERRGYVIRRASVADVNALCVLEQECWAAGLRSSREKIMRRLGDGRSVFVAVTRDGEGGASRNGGVVGCLYTQRIVSTDVLTSHGEQELHHSVGGPVVQLLAIAVRPTSQSRGIGPGLRDHALLCAALDEDVPVLDMVAATRCSSFRPDAAASLDKDTTRYEAALVTATSVSASSGRRGQENSTTLDPTVLFHVSGGARVDGVLQGYWPEDVANLGHAVLVRYALRESGLGLSASVPARLPVASAPTVSAAVAASGAQVVTLQGLYAIVQRVLGSDSSSGISSSGGGGGGGGIDAGTMKSFAHTPWMELGLDSLRMTELSAVIRLDWGSVLPASFGVVSIFSHSTPSALVRNLTGRQQEAASTAAIAGAMTAAVAISGMSCRFPGGVDSPQAFHDKLVAGLDTPSPLPPSWVGSPLEAGGTDFASLLSDEVLDAFSPGMFNISDAEAREMDPHLRLNLMLGYEALLASELVGDDGRTREGSGGLVVGVFAGHCNADWACAHAQLVGTKGPLTGINLAGASMANRLSYAFNLTGPSVVVDTACSSSMAALHAARQSLVLGECDAALVVSSDLILSRAAVQIRGAAGMLSGTGRCRVFDAGADGYVRGEGGGAVVLRAMQGGGSDDFPVSGLLRATAMTQDGTSASFTAPSAKSQERMLRAALSGAQVSAGDIAYVECHGTGTALGDPIEMGALWEALGRPREQDNPLILGAVKSNIGHLEGAAGVAGLIKTVMALQHGFVGGNLHLSELNPHMNAHVGKSVLLAPPCGVSLHAAGGGDVLCAGVSSFGSGGTNVHAVLQAVEGRRPVCGPASTAASALTRIKDVALLFTGQGVVGTEMCARLFRSDEGFRASIDASSVCLRSIARADSNDVARATKSGEAGAGAANGPSLTHVMYPSVSGSPMTPPVAAALLQADLVYGQCALFALQVALYRYWEARGLTAGAVVGHSIGEFAAAVAAGLCSAEAGMALVYARARLLQRSTVEGSMVAVRASVKEVEAALARLAPTDAKRVSVAAENGPRSCVLSGDAGAVKQAVGLLDCSHRALAVTRAYHSPLVADAAAAYEAQLRTAPTAGGCGLSRFDAASAGCPVLVSTATGRVLSPTADAAAHWGSHMAGRVRFLEALSAVHALLAPAPKSDLDSDSELDSLSTSGVTFLEVGPDNTLTKLGRASGLEATWHASAAVAVPGRAAAFPWRTATLGVAEAAAAYGNTGDSARLQEDEVLPMVLAAVGAVLPGGEGAHDVHADTPLGAAGVDSLGVLQMRSTLAHQLGGAVFPVAVHDGREHTARSIAALLARAATVRPSSGAPVTPPSSGASSGSPGGFTRRYPATAMQQSMLYYFMTDSTANTFVESFEWTVSPNSMAVQTRESLDVDVFLACWKCLVHRHASLRACFDLEDGEGGSGAPSMVVHTPMHPALESAHWFRAHDVSCPVDTTWTAARDVAVEARRLQLRAESLDPFQAPLFRVDVSRLGDPGRTQMEHVVSLTIHHSIMDGYAMMLLLRELSVLYHGYAGLGPGGLHVPALAPAPNPVQDSAHLVGSHEEAAQTGAAWKGMCKFWDDRLEVLASRPMGTVGHQVPMVDVADSGVARVEVALDGGLTAALGRTAAAAGVSTKAVYHAAWAVAYSSALDHDHDDDGGAGISDAVYGTTVANRGLDIAGVENTVGLLVNTVPVPVSLTALMKQGCTSLHAYLHATDADLKCAEPHEALPLPHILRAAGLRDTPFSCIFDYQPLVWETTLGNLTLGDCRLVDRVGCALTMRVLGTGAAASGSGSGSRGLRVFASSECGRLGADFLEGLVDRYILALQLLAQARQSSSSSSPSSSSVVGDDDSQLQELVDKVCALPLSVDDCDSVGSYSDDGGGGRPQRDSFDLSSFDGRLSRRSSLGSQGAGSRRSSDLGTLDEGTDTLFDGGSFSPKEVALMAIFADLFEIDAAEIGKGSNFFDLGGDSLKSIRVVSMAKRCGLKISVSQIFDLATLERIAHGAVLVGSSAVTVLGTNSGTLDDNPTFTITHAPAQAHEPYPMVGVNAAHFVGLHTSSFGGGSVSPQIYFEWEFGANTVPAVPLHLAHFQAALNAFITRHPTFRSIVRHDGMMETLRPDQVPVYAVLETCGDMEHVAARRGEILKQKLDPHTWPLFSVYSTQVPGEGLSRVHFTVSLFLMDAMSDLILRHELSQLYRDAFMSADERVALSAPASLLFRDYVSSMSAQLAKSDDYQRARAFWHGRLDDLPGGPMLPTLPTGGGGQAGVFRNMHKWLAADEWARARINCARHGVTVPAMLIACYSIALSVWSGSERFLLNLLLCLRHQVHPEVNKVVGNCSSTMLCVVDLREELDGSPCSFRKLVLRIAGEVAQNLEHAVIGGIEVMQELNRVRGNTFSAVAPFIFTSPIGVEAGNAEVSGRDWIFEEKFFSERVPHTACVNAVKSDPSGSATCSLDVVDGTFPEEVVQGLFDTYCAALEVACNKSPEAWDVPLRSTFQQATPVPNAALSTPIDPRCLHDGFLAHARAGTTDSAAMVALGDDGGRDVFAYPDTAAMTTALAEALVAVLPPPELRDPDTPPVVAIFMFKGWEQVVAALATLQAGCTFLPMDAALWPQKRVVDVAAMSKTCAILIQSRVREGSPWVDALACPWLPAGTMPVLDVSPLAAAAAAGAPLTVPTTGPTPSDARLALTDVVCDAEKIAYLIYTSGSTGKPKGVRCHHRGSMNTNVYLNELYGVGPSDALLSVSSLAFDLSIYDIFGVLEAGATVVVPPARSMRPPTPDVWAAAMHTEKVSLWNSVPALMELLVSHLELEGERLAPTLRLIFMSGDWVPLSLASRIRALSDNPGLRIISMGGATEAAIWSNIYEIGPPGREIPEGWASVPYGRPMRNQTMYILDGHLDHCQPWVTGAIHIGGAGVADGYHMNPSQTAMQFITHPRTGEKLFYTGDLGRVRPGGLLEILGRKDGQVKIGGFRIELGEIERVISKRRDLVTTATVAVRDKTLCAYVVPRLTEGDAEDIERQHARLLKVLRGDCRKALTEYMIPRHFLLIDSLPLSNNGKVDKDRLPAPSSLAKGGAAMLRASDGKVVPRTPLEGTARAAMAVVLGVTEDEICVTNDSFYSLGGTSLTSLQLIFKLQEATGGRLQVQDLFAAPTAEGIAAALGSTSSGSADAIQVLMLQQGAPPSPLPPSSSYPTAPTALVVINPAGASGLCYLDLVKLLPAHLPVLALDDGCISNDAPFAFDSIDDVVSACMPALAKVRTALKLDVDVDVAAGGEAVPPPPLRLLLAGWSYGGVVATELARRLSVVPSPSDAVQQTTAGPGPGPSPGPVQVVGLCLFDSPLVRPAPRSADNAGIGAPAVEGVAKDHFAACHVVLDHYYSSGGSARAGAPILTCPLTHVTPADGSCGPSGDVLQAVTTAPAATVACTGSHWTMLYGDNADVAASSVCALLP